MVRSGDVVGKGGGVEKMGMWRCWRAGHKAEHAQRLRKTRCFVTDRGPP